MKKIIAILFALMLVPETLCLQAVEPHYWRNGVLFVERSGELRLLARLST